MSDFLYTNKSCLNHQTKTATYYCESCKNYICDDCIKTFFLVDKKTFICKKCKGKSVDIHLTNLETRLRIAREKENEENLNFWLQLLITYIYPLYPKNIISFIPVIFLIFNITFLLNLILKKLIFLLGPTIIFIVFILYFYYTTALHIIEISSISNNKDYDEWPNYLELEYWTYPFTLVLIAFILCFYYPIHYFLLNNSMDLQFIKLFSYGFFFFPMILLSITMRRELDALNPLHILTSIVRNIIPYTALVLHWIFCTIIFLNFMLIAFVGDNIILNSLQISIYLVYYSFLIHRPLGLFYRCYHSRLPFLSKL